MKRVCRNVLLLAMLAPLSIGWRATANPPTDGLVYPVNMTLSDGRLFVSDRHSGVQVFDVTDPTQPAHTLTIPLRGNRGTAVRGDIVYANDYRFLRVLRVNKDSYELLQTIDTGPAYDAAPWVGDDVVDGGFGCACGAQDNPVVQPEASGGGSSSYATFVVIDDYLYYLDDGRLVTMDISNPAYPEELAKIRIGWEAETLYPTDDYLFLGGTRGMYIFDRSNPGRPKPIGELQHFRACDPVVVSGSVAYVTLRGGNACGETRDILLCVSVENPASPRVIGEKPLDTPYGLAVRDPYLYVSTGESGFTLIDVTQPAMPSQLAAWDQWDTKDFIWYDRYLYVLGFRNVRIFDVAEPGHPKLLSTIAPGDPSPVATTVSTGAR